MCPVHLTTISVNLHFKTYLVPARQERLGRYSFLECIYICRTLTFIKVLEETTRITEYICSNNITITIWDSRCQIKC